MEDKLISDLRLPRNKSLSLASCAGTLASGLAFWILFRIIFPRLVSITASPIEAGLNILAPTILFAIFVWMLTMTILIVPNRLVRALVYLAVALFYVPIHWIGVEHVVLSLIGILITQILYDLFYRGQLDNQKTPQWGRTVLTSGVFPIFIFSITITSFYLPIYVSNVTRNVGVHNPVLIANASQLGYFFMLQIFLIISTLIAAGLVGLTATILEKSRMHVTFNT